MEARRLNDYCAAASVDTEGVTDEVSASQQVHPASTKELPPVSAFHLLERLKSVINDVVSSLQNPASSLSVDDCIRVTEEGLQALKTVKVDRRIECRRQVNLNSTRMSGRSPSNRADDEGEHGEGGDAAGPTNNHHLYSPKSKKVSPKRMEREYNHDELEAARHASALRSEERQRKAEERRLEKLQEMRSKLVAAGERSMLAKQRRIQAEERLKSHTTERQENGLRRVEEAREQTKERARRGHSRVEEVRLSCELRHQTKALLLDRRMSEVEHNQEQKREELQRLAQERNGAMLAAAERRRNISQERIERQQQREQQRRDNLRRLEEQKKIEKDMKEHRAEEWEKKVQQRQRDVCAEAEARSRKVEERIQQSAQLREEKREIMRQRLGKQEQKIKEVRQRKERDTATKPTIQDLMPVIPQQEEEQLSQKLAKVAAATVRQGKTFLENYQKESAVSTKDLNRSKLRSIISRLGTNTSPASLAQCRQPLHDLLSTMDLADIDHEYVRYFNAYEIFTRVMMDSRRANDMTTFRLAYNALLRFLSDTKEGKQHVLTCVRSGNLAPLLLCVREEIKALRRQTHSGPLAASLGILQLCFERISIEVQTNTKLITVRDQLLADLDAASIEKYCIAVTQTSTEEEDLEVVYNATRLLYSQVCILSRRKGEWPITWFKQVTCAFFTLLQNILTPDGSPLTEMSPVLSARRVVIIFIVFRVLNSLARWKLEILQELLHGPSSDKGLGVYVDPKAEPAKAPDVITRMEMFHVLCGFFTYVQAHTDMLENLQGEKLTGEGVSASFEEALRFGITLSQVPPLPVPQVLNSPSSGTTITPARPQYHLRAALHECLLFIGYLCVQDKPIQAMFSWGKGKSLFSRILSSLPFQYFISARHILFPTLLAILVDSADNLALAKREMDIKPLLTFIDEEYQGLPKKAKLYAFQRHTELRAVSLEEKVSQPVRWADLLDGDDDELFPANKRDSQPPVQAPTIHPLATVEKERLYKLLKSPGITSSGYFKVERRFPIALWPSVIEQLTGAVKESNKDE